MRHSKQSPHCELSQSPRCQSRRHKKNNFLRTLRKMSELQQLLVSVYWCSYQVSSHTTSWCGTVAALEQMKNTCKESYKLKRIINQQLPGRHLHLMVPAGDPQHPETLIRPRPSTTFWTVLNLHFSPSKHHHVIAWTDTSKKSVSVSGRVCIFVILLVTSVLRLIILGESDLLFSLWVLHVDRHLA